MSLPVALIIEDDLQLSQIFAKTLQGQFETEIAGDGGSALARLAQLTPDLVLLDLNLPGPNGGEILHTIREDLRLAAVPVILCTADDRQADMLQDKADVVLLKPISPSQLRSIASRFITL